MRSEKVIRTAFFGTWALFLAYQIYQAFATSADIRFVSWRGEDDSGFHSTLRLLTERLFNGDIGAFLRAFDYGYGWLFWFLSFLVSLPGYFLSVNHITDRPLIVSVSLLSLFLFTYGTYFLYRSFEVLSKSKNLSRALALTCLLLPAAGYASLKWHPCSFNFFFNALAVYLALTLDLEREKNLRWIALAAAASFAVRLLGVFILPALFGILLSRSLPLSRAGGLRFVRLGLYYCAFALLLAFPQLVFSGFWAPEWQRVISRIRESSSLVGNYSFEPQSEDLKYRYNVIWGATYLGVTSTLALLGSFLVGIADLVRRRDWKPLLVVGSLFMAFLVAWVFNIFVARGIPDYAINHLFPMAPFALFALALSTKNRIYQGLVTIFFLSVLLLNPGRSAVLPERIYGAYRYIERIDGYRVRSALQFQPIVADRYREKGSLRILFDRDVPHVLHPIYDSNLTFRTLVDNLSEAVTDPPYDFIAMTKNESGKQNARLSMSPERFDEYLTEREASISALHNEKDRQKGLDEFQHWRKVWSESRELYKKLANEGTFAGNQFRKAYEDESYVLFERVPMK